MDIFNALSELCSSGGVSGSESDASSCAGRMLKEYTGEVYTDRLGNVSGLVKSAKANAKTLLLDAHIDEIGLMVTGYAGGSFLRFRAVGGVDFRLLPSCRVIVLGKRQISGIITALPIHILSEEDRDKPFKPEELFIDTGLEEDKLKELIPIGTLVMFDSPLRKLSDDAYCGKAIDDRAGAAAILKALDIVKDETLNCNIVALFSAMEELGSRGAKTAAFAMDYDLALCVDVSHAKTPDAQSDGTFEFAGGPMIGAGPLLSAGIVQRLKECAEKAQIKYQLEVMEGDTGTNARALMFAREGTPTGLVSIPLKYMHTPNEVVSASDIENSAALLAEFILSCSREDM